MSLATLKRARVNDLFSTVDAFVYKIDRQYVYIFSKDDEIGGGSFVLLRDLQQFKDVEVATQEERDSINARLNLARLQHKRLIEAQTTYTNARRGRQQKKLRKRKL